MITYEQLVEKQYAGEIKRVRTSYKRGYISRKTKEYDRPVNEYQGKYGKGYTVESPCYNSSQYHFITYYIEVEK